MSVDFFSEVDRNKTSKKIQSEYPAWYLTTQINEMQESVSAKRRKLDAGVIPPAEVPYMRTELEKEEKRLDEINNSKPKVTEKERDAMSKAYNHLSKEIKASMFTRTDMQKGLADAHEEARRMVTPIIKVNEKIAELAESCGVKVKDGHISRNEASKIFKITGRFLGEQSNVEALRRDRSTTRR